MPMPAEPKIYHIVHVDRLSSIISDGFLWCDAEIAQRNPSGTVIGMTRIKQRRLQLLLGSHPNLYVGDCVPFYFCPRSVMLYVIHKGNNADLTYRGGQNPIVHLEADLRQIVSWAEEHNLRWAFTLSNAGSVYSEFRYSLEELSDINWDAVQEESWSQCRDEKQAEFLIERQFPWDLISRVGVYSRNTYNQVNEAFKDAEHKPQVEVLSDWYY